MYINVVQAPLEHSRVEGCPYRAKEFVYIHFYKAVTPKGA